MIVNGQESGPIGHLSRCGTGPGVGDVERSAVLMASLVFALVHLLVHAAMCPTVFVAISERGSGGKSDHRTDRKKKNGMAH